jgi:hypothetical protein
LGAAYFEAANSAGQPDAAAALKPTVVETAAVEIAAGAAVVVDAAAEAATLSVAAAADAAVSCSLVKTYLNG